MNAFPGSASAPPSTLCIGAAHWDLIARADQAMRLGDDAPGRIRRQPGGVALNVAYGLARLGAAVGLCAVLGDDAEGRELCARLEAEGVDTRPMIVIPEASTGGYLAIEAADGELVAAVADTTALDAAEAILSETAIERIAAGGWRRVLVEGNLFPATIRAIAAHAKAAGLALVANPTSPAKAGNLAPLLDPALAPTLVTNRAEAEILLGRATADAAEAARLLAERCGGTTLVTDGPRPAALSLDGGLVTETPEPIAPSDEHGSTTGAGDAALAAFLAIAAPAADPTATLRTVLAAARDHLKGTS